MDKKITLTLTSVFLALAAALSAAARIVPGFADWYTSCVYPVIVGTEGRLSGLFTFSLSEMLCIILPVFVIADLVMRFPDICQAFKHLALLISLLLLLYTACCGVNYYSSPFVSPDVYGKASFTEEDLVSFCEYTISMLEESSGVSYPEGAELADKAIDAMKKLSREYESLSGFYPRPKQLTVLSRFFSMMGVSGIYSPFTVEANINGEMPGMEKPFTACHELSHLRGFMNEGEANYIGWLACIGSGDPAFERSGWLIAWSYAGSSLKRTDPEKYALLREKLPGDASGELDDNHDFWVSHENKASEIQDRLNDSYLRSNGQSDGIKTYSHLTSLMLIWYSSQNCL